MWIKLQDIHKHYGNIKANNGISLTVAPGTIHGILGENGAGKSTLMKILSGFIPKTSGTILVNNVALKFNSPAHASKAGIGMLYQDPMDFPCLSVLENFQIEKRKGISLNQEAYHRRFADLAQHLGFDLNPHDTAGNLTVGERQQLELIRLLGIGNKALILDEPTTGISAVQKKILFSALKKLAAEGRSIILVSHKLEDIDALCDKVTVLCHGRVKGETDKPFDKNSLMKMMFGETPSPPRRYEHVPGKPVLSMGKVSAPGGRSGLVECSVLIREREIIGLAGLEGSGQEVFLRTAAGLSQPKTGKIYIKNTSMKDKNYHLFNREGVTFLPAARLEEGLISGLHISEHFILKNEQKQFIIPQKKIFGQATRQIRKFHIKGTPDSAVESLSGGNQQRLLLSMLPKHPCLLLLENPTRGLDLESVRWVWHQLQKLCESKTSIVFSSSDLDEILEVANRVLIFFEGSIIKDLNTCETDRDELGRAISGIV